MADEPGWASIPRAMLHDGNVPRDAKLVYLILSSHVGAKETAWPSHKRISVLLGMSISTVKRQMAWLRDNHYIEWTQRRVEPDNPNSMLTTNEYRLVLGSAPRPATADSSPGTYLGSDRHHLGSQGTYLGSEGARGRSTQSEGYVHTELGVGSQGASERTSLNEPQGTSTTKPRKRVAPRGTRITEDWKPTPADILWQRSENITDEQAKRQTEQFVSHFLAESGSKAVKVDWSQAWKNWIRRSVDWGTAAPRSQGARRTTDDKVRSGLSLAARMAQQEQAQPLLEIEGPR